MRWLAEGAICDGARDGTLTKLASLGTQGKHAGNARRDLMRSLYQDMHLPSPFGHRISQAAEVENGPMATTAGSGPIGSLRAYVEGSSGCSSTDSGLQSS